MNQSWINIYYGDTNRKDLCDENVCKLTYPCDSQTFCSFYNLSLSRGYYLIYVAVSTFQSKVQVIYKEHFCNFTLCLHRTKKALKDNVGVTFFGALFIIFKRMAML